MTASDDLRGRGIGVPKYRKATAVTGSAAAPPCPKCGGQSITVDSRRTGDAGRRRRVCVKCEHRFTTWETTILPSARVAREAVEVLRTAADRIEVKLRDNDDEGGRQ